MTRALDEPIEERNHLLIIGNCVLSGLTSLVLKWITLPGL